MKMYSMANASREFARWRTLFSTDGPAAPPRVNAAAPFEDTACEWPHTEWSETLPLDDGVDLDLAAGA